MPGHGKGGKVLAKRGASLNRVIAKAPPRAVVSDDYVERITEVVNENAKEEILERKKLYDQLGKEKEGIENKIRTQNLDVVSDTVELQKNEEEKRFLEDMECVENLRLYLQRKSVKSQVLKQQILQNQEEIGKSNQKVEKIKSQMNNVFMRKVSSDPEADTLLSHLEKQISQKTRELECPVCYEVCQPPILRCPEFHLVCGQCWPRMRHCGECRTPYGGQMRHRYAERGHQELQELVKTREEHLKKNGETDV
eukprot:GFUD01126522.1.p1 GENE.GFUD01126522.1~~GFUD01126522.1.p1  ORF type:complete len:252 (-),score=75.22 GFUD01126522.1:23-778(-)